jgi:hypothetical protein
VVGHRIRPGQRRRLTADFARDLPPTAQSKSRPDTPSSPPPARRPSGTGYSARRRRRRRWSSRSRSSIASRRRLGAPSRDSALTIRGLGRLGDRDEPVRRSTQRSVWLIATILVACGPITPSTPSALRAASTARASAQGSAAPSIDPSLVGAASGHDPLLPTLGNGGYDVESYDIAIETNPVDNQSTLRVVIDSVASQRLGRFSLDYSGIAPGSVRIDDTAAAFSEAGGKLTVTLSRVINTGGRFRTVVDIAGLPNAVRGVGWAWRGAEQCRRSASTTCCRPGFRPTTTRPTRR